MAELARSVPLSAGQLFCAGPKAGHREVEVILHQRKKRIRNVVCAYELEALHTTSGSMLVSSEDGNQPGASPGAVA